MSDPARSARFGASELAANLRHGIRNGSIGAFERLPAERMLAATHNVSRGTVRDALLRLSREGLIDIRPGSGAYVMPQPGTTGDQAMTDASPLDLIDARCALEPHICRLAVMHARPEDLDRLTTLIDQMETRPDDAPAFEERDTEFHAALVQITGNTLLIRMAGQIRATFGQRRWQRLRQRTLHRDTIALFNLQHRQIVTAIRDRNPDRAEQEMKNHLESSRLTLLAGLGA